MCQRPCGSIRTSERVVVTSPSVIAYARKPTQPHLAYDATRSEAVPCERCAGGVDRAAGVIAVQAADRDLVRREVDEAVAGGDEPVPGEVGAEVALLLAAFDQRLDALEHQVVPVAHAGFPQGEHGGGAKTEAACPGRILDYRV